MLLAIDGWAGGETVIVAVGSLLLVAWLIRTSVLYWRKRHGLSWWKRDSSCYYHLISDRRFTIPLYRWMTLVGTLLVLGGFVAIALVSADSRADTARFRQLPAVVALNPEGVDANSGTVTTDKFGCRATFKLNDDGTFSHSGTVQNKVTLTREGVLTCTDEPLDAPQSSVGN